MADERGGGSLGAIPHRTSLEERSEAGRVPVCASVSYLSTAHNPRCVGFEARLDTVGFAVPIESNFEREGLSFRGTVTNGRLGNWRWSRSLDGGGFVGYGVGGMAWVEASLPKRASGENVEAVRQNEALELMRELHREVGETATYDRTRRGHVFEASSLVRLDLVRDFDGVRQLPALLDGLAGIRQKGRDKVRRYADGARNQAETLRVGPAAWSCTLYDKHRESRYIGKDGRVMHRADEGRVRFEARLHADQLQSQTARGKGCHLRLVAEMMGEDGENRLKLLRRWKWDRVGFGRKVSAMSTVINDVFCSEGLTRREKRELWAYLTARPFGIDLGYSAPTERKYAAMAAALGITLGAHELDDAFEAYLDYDRGIEVVQAA